MNTPKALIYADFNKYAGSRLILTCLGTHRDLEKYSIALAEGLKLVFYHPEDDVEGNPDDLVVEGVVQYDKDEDRWVADIIWDEIKNISKLTLEEKQKLGL
ncbi:MAG: hypothetical protein DMF63_11495 [Acidobacteria bacterium]|nr:MAG: hypothetical protein DMF63_11495 [Acidobacteriota bacterium]